MSISNDPRFTRIRAELQFFHDEAEDEYEIDYYKRLLRDFDEGMLMIQDIEELYQIGMVRNPGFPGDEIGWLRDDFDENDEEEDEDKGN